MPLVTEKVRENAKKCEECAFLHMAKSVDKNSVLADEARVAASGMMKVTCNVCPNGKDFEKVYGKKPYDYFKDLIEGKSDK